MQKKIQKERGITLVALIITVIILLILAGATLNLVIGENGLIKRTKEAKEASNTAQLKEETQFQEYDDYISGQLEQEKSYNINVNISRWKLL
mgnify:FL=1